VVDEVDTALSDVRRVERRDELWLAVRREKEDQVREHAPLDLIEHPVPPRLVRRRDRDVLVRADAVVDVDNGVVELVKDDDERLLGGRLDVCVQLAEVVAGLPRPERVAVIRAEVPRHEETDH